MSDPVEQGEQVDVDFNHAAITAHRFTTDPTFTGNDHYQSGYTNLGRAFLALRERVLLLEQREQDLDEIENVLGTWTLTDQEPTPGDVPPPNEPSSE